MQNATEIYVSMDILHATFRVHYTMFRIAPCEQFAKLVRQTIHTQREFVVRLRNSANPM